MMGNEFGVVSADAPLARLFLYQYKSGLMKNIKLVFHPLLLSENACSATNDMLAVSSSLKRSNKDFLLSKICRMKA